MSNKTTDFAPSITRIYLFFAALFQWIRTIFKGQYAQPQVEQAKPISQRETYIERNKSKFLQTFQIESDNWNANVEPLIRDPAQMAKILTDPNNEFEKKWRSRVLIENTPRGNVIMFYDIYKRGFSYYCDNAVMPYDIMNAAAMKYVLTFHCRDFFVDSNILPQQPPTGEDMDKDKDTTNKKTKTVMIDKQAFVKFKTYNTATKKAGVKPEEDKTINCFLHLGGVRNWTPISKKTKPNPLNGFQTDMMPGSKKLSYLEYKKQLSSQ